MASRATILATIAGAITFLAAVAIFAKAANCVDGNPVTSIGSSMQCSTGWQSPVMGTPNSRTLSLATAYQATDPTKIAIFTITLTSTANFSLSGGTTNSATIVIGPTSGVAGGTGTIINTYSNSVTGTIAVGLNMNSAQTTSYTINLPAGWYIAVRQTSGSVSISNAFDQSVG